MSSKRVFNPDDMIGRKVFTPAQKGFIPDTPRMVSIYELRDKLLPFMTGIPWAEDALMDLWQMGAPSPNPADVPCEHNCESAARGGPTCGKWGCRKIKRLLLPSQFAEWWRQVSERQGVELRVK